MPRPPIDADALYEVRTTCPHCDCIDIVLVRLDAILTQTRAEAFLSVKASPKKIEHDCEQPSLLGHLSRQDDDDQQALALPYVDHETGEVIGGLSDDVVEAEIVDDGDVA